MKMYKDTEKDTKVTLDDALAEVEKFPIVEGSFIGFFNERNVMHACMKKLSTGPIQTGAFLT